MRRSAALAAVLLLLAACGRSETRDTAQNALGGVGRGPASGKGGGVQNPGNTSGNNPEGEVSPSGPGTGNQS